MSNRGRPILLFLPGAERLAREVHSLLGKNWQLMPCEAVYQPDGELKTVLLKGAQHSVREADTFLIQTPAYKSERSPQDLAMEMLFGLDTLTRCCAHKRTAVMPWFPFACQDKPRRRETGSAGMIARALKLFGATHVISFDVHNDAIEMAFLPCECTFNGLYGWWLLHGWLEKNFRINSQPEKFAVSAADVGGGNRIQYIEKHTGLMAVLPSKRKNHDTAEATDVVVTQDVTDRTVIIVDDMVRSGSTIAKAAPALMNAGAKKIIVAATHPNFCKDCVDILDDLHQKEILTAAVFTNSFKFPNDFAAQHPWFAQVSLAKKIAETLDNIHEGKSVADVYLDEEPKNGA